MSFSDASLHFVPVDFEGLAQYALGEDGRQDNGLISLLAFEAGDITPDFHLQT